MVWCSVSEFLTGLTVTAALTTSSSSMCEMLPDQEKIFPRTDVTWPLRCRLKKSFCLPAVGSTGLQISAKSDWPTFHASCATCKVRDSCELVLLYVSRFWRFHGSTSSSLSSSLPLTSRLIALDVLALLPKHPGSPEPVSFEAESSAMASNLCE